MQHSSHRLLLVGLAAVVALIGIISLVALLVVGPGKHETTGLVPDKKLGRQVATVEEVSKDMDSLQASMKQFAADHATISAALKDKQVKVSS